MRSPLLALTRSAKIGYCRKHSIRSKLGPAFQNRWTHISSNNKSKTVFLDVTIKVPHGNTKCNIRVPKNSRITSVPKLDPFAKVCINKDENLKDIVSLLLQSCTKVETPENRADLSETEGLVIEGDGKASSSNKDINSNPSTTNPEISHREIKKNVKNISRNILHVEDFQFNKVSSRSQLVGKTETCDRVAKPNNEQLVSRGAQLVGKRETCDKITKVNGERPGKNELNPRDNAKSIIGNDTEDSRLAFLNSDGEMRACFRMLNVNSNKNYANPVHNNYFNDIICMLKVHNRISKLAEGGCQAGEGKYEQSGVKGSNFENQPSGSKIPCIEQYSSCETNDMAESKSIPSAGEELYDIMVKGSNFESQPSESNISCIKEYLLCQINNIVQYKSIHSAGEQFNDNAERKENCLKVDGIIGIDGLFLQGISENTKVLEQNRKLFHLPKTVINEMKAQLYELYPASPAGKKVEETMPSGSNEENKNTLKHKTGGDAVNESIDSKGIKQNSFRQKGINFIDMCVQANYNLILSDSINDNEKKFHSSVTSTKEMSIPGYNLTSNKTKKNCNYKEIHNVTNNYWGKKLGVSNISSSDSSQNNKKVNFSLIDTNIPVKRFTERKLEPNESVIRDTKMAEEEYKKMQKLRKYVPLIEEELIKLKNLKLRNHAAGNMENELQPAANEMPPQRNKSQDTITEKGSFYKGRVMSLRNIETGPCRRNAQILCDRMRMSSVYKKRKAKTSKNEINTAMLSDDETGSFKPVNNSGFNVQPVEVGTMEKNATGSNPKRNYSGLKDNLKRRKMESLILGNNIVDGKYKEKGTSQTGPQFKYEGLYSQPHRASIDSIELVKLENKQNNNSKHLHKNGLQLTKFICQRPKDGAPNELIEQECKSNTQIKGKTLKGLNKLQKSILWRDRLLEVEQCKIKNLLKNKAKFCNNVMVLIQKDRSLVKVNKCHENVQDDQGDSLLKPKKASQQPQVKKAQSEIVVWDNSARKGKAIEIRNKGERFAFEQYNATKSNDGQPSKDDDSNQAKAENTDPVKQQIKDKTKQFCRTLVELIQLLSLSAVKDIERVKLKEIESKKDERIMNHYYKKKQKGNNV